MTDSVFPNDAVTCSAPWYSMRIDPNGEYTYCDFSAERYQSDLLPSEWFDHGKEITKVRQQVQQGVCVSGCKQCYKQEEQNQVSYRSRRNHQAALYRGNFFRESLLQSPAFDRMQQATIRNKGPAFLHVSLNNICNLACRMCYPKYSSKLATLQIKTGVLEKTTKILNDWTSDNSKWTDFCENLVLKNQSLICLHFMGGEPLVNDKFFEILKKCVAEQRTNFHVTFVTNGTIWDNSYMDMLSKFQSVSIEVSIENFHPSNDYIRIGSDYLKIKNNIESIIANKPDHISLVLRTVPQALSIMHYDTLLDFALANALNIDRNFLTSPPSLHINVLPSEIRQKIAQSLTVKYQDLLELGTTSAAENVNNLRNASQYRTQISTHLKELLAQLAMPSPDNVQDLRKDFVAYNKKLDQAVELSFQEVFPDLADFYEKYNKN